MSDEKIVNKKDDKIENLISTDDKKLDSVDDDEINRITGGIRIGGRRYNVQRIGQELEDGPVEVKIKI